MTFDNFLSPLLPLLESVTKSHGLTYPDSQDAIQETTLSLWKKFSSGKIDLSKNIKSYALQLINWRAKDILRAKKRSAELFSLAGEENDLDTLPAPEKEKTRRYPLEVLQYAKTRLSKRDYLIFIDHLRGKPVKETANKFGLDNAMVYMVRCRSLKKIKTYERNTKTLP